MRTPKPLQVSICVLLAYPLKLRTSNHASDRVLMQSVADEGSLKVLMRSRVPSGHSASTSH